MAVDLKEILNQGWIGSIVGFIGVILAILAFALKPRPRLATQINTLEVVGHNSVFPPDLEFLFKGKHVPRVTMSRIAIWNIANTTIRRDQIVESDPLRIVTSEESNVLDAIVLKRTRDVTDTRLILNAPLSNQVAIDFDFLDPKTVR